MNIIDTISTREAAESDTHELAEAWFLDLMQRMEAGEEGHFKMWMSPQKSKVLLDNNKDNRPLREGRVVAISLDIKEDRWKRNGQTVSIADTGDLNDGQHRLTAIERANMPVLLDLIWGVPRESRDTVDVGAAKTAADMLRMGGMTVNGSTVAAAARQVLGFEEYGSLTQLSRVSTPRIVARSNSDKKLQLAASWAASSPRSFTMMVTATIATTALYLLSSIDEKAALNFMSRFRDGDNLAKDNPIWRLRERLHTEKKLSPNYKLELIVKTWNLWIQDKPAQKIQLDGRIPTILSVKMVNKAIKDMQA